MEEIINEKKRIWDHLAEGKMKWKNQLRILPGGGDESCKMKPTRRLPGGR